MRNKDLWVPTKYVQRCGKLTASPDRKQVGVGSRVMASLIAACFDAYLRQYARGRLIDLGCGTVPLYAAYEPFITENVCVDWGGTTHSSLYVDQECDLAGDLPFANCDFDTIILSDVLEHIPQPEGLWREMARILAPGGRVLLSVPFLYWVHEAPHDYYRYTEFALRRFAHQVGLKILVLRPLGGAPEVLADVLAKNLLMYLPVVGKWCAAAIQGGTRALVGTRLGRRLSDGTAAAFPIGYFLVAEKPDTVTSAAAPQPVR